MLVSHVDEGSGPAVVLLHSGICDARMWGPQAAFLRDTYRVIRPDMRGFGETPLPPARFSFPADVVHLLDHLHIDRASLVGSSLGGRVALEIAVSHPHRVDSLVLLCPAYQGVARTEAAQAFGEREDALLGTGDLDAAVDLNVSTWLGPEASAKRGIWFG